jgi:hypothetical protein
MRRGSSIAVRAIEIGQLIISLSTGRRVASARGPSARSSAGVFTSLCIVEA